MKREAFAAVIIGPKFGVGLAIEDESGYYPQIGFGLFDSYDEARVRADGLNEQLGLDKYDAAAIVASSMRTQNQAKRKVKA